MATGRTVGKYFKFQIESSSGAMADIPVNTISGVGISYDEIDVSALQEALKSFLVGQGTVALDIGGPVSNNAIVAASGTGAVPALSGSHTVLYPLAAGTQTAKSFGAYLGIQNYWSTGDPVFGGIDCILVSNYIVDAAAMTYSASLRLAASRTNDPAWGSAAITASS